MIPHTGLVKADLGAKDGRIAAITDKISTHDAETFVDANGKAVFPGAGIRTTMSAVRPFSEDAESESRSSLIGGVTTLLVTSAPATTTSTSRTVSHDLSGSSRTRRRTFLYRLWIPPGDHDGSATA